MSGTPLHSIVLSFLPCLIPLYAFRLCRAFGIQRVGWMVFAVFSLLTTVQVLRFWQPLGVGLDPELTLDLLNFLVPILLLIGMTHIEMILRERLQLEDGETRLRAELELLVKKRTSELDKANEDLQHEISLRRQGAEELRKSKEQYRFLFEENPQPMWISEVETGRFLAFNIATLRHYGYSGTEFRDLTVKDLYPPGESEELGPDAAKDKSGGQTRRIWRHCKKDGTLIEVELTCLDLTYAGCPARLVLAHDVTAQRRLQKELLQAQKREVTAQLAGGIADNFKTLITAIEGYANVLVQKCQDPTTAEPLKRIAATAACAGGLNRQLLALVRRHPMQAQPVDLNKLIEEQSGSLQRMLGNKITLEKNCQSEAPPIMADPALVEQILRNLVLNARDAMPNGGSVTLSTAGLLVEEGGARGHEDIRAGAFVCLTVADTGCGMSAEVQSRLFEPFFTTKGTAKAAGLGLATVHGLVKQQSGWIEVSSQEGAGSRFSVFFPCPPASARTEANGRWLTAATT
jgi:PAS domain S-box-containing protein